MRPPVSAWRALAVVPDVKNEIVVSLGPAIVELGPIANPAMPVEPAALVE